MILDGMLGNVEVGSDFIDRDLYNLAFSLGVTLALLLLGPGAFSIDGRSFGRRLIRPLGLK